MKTFIIFLAFLTSCGGKSSSSASSEVSSAPGFEESQITKDDSYHSRFMKLINDHRTSLGLKAIVQVDGLAEIAYDHSSDMANLIIAFGHSGFSTRCSEGRAVIDGGNLCGENVAKGQNSPEKAFASWMNSSGHRANIENARYTHTGFGYAQSSSGTYYWTQIFLEKN